jgi:hypothetical protein
MSAVSPRKSDSPAETESEDLGKEFVLTRWVWGPLLTVGFYLALPHLGGLPLSQSLFRGHPVQYAETGLFFVALAILLRKAIAVVQERRALKLVAIDISSLQAIASPADRAASLLAATANVPAAIRNTKLVSRIREICEYVKPRGGAAAVEEHLRYLGDLAIEKLSAGHAQVRTLIWSVPVLGGLGTLAGFAALLRGLSAESSEAPLALALAGIAGCFDPALQALGLSLVLMVLRLAVERQEAHALEKIERFGILQLGPCFNDETRGGGSPLVAAEAKAATALIERTEALIVAQTELWQKGLEGVRTRWLETAQTQEKQFAQALEQGLSSGLASHTQQLDDARAEFLKGFRAVGLELSRITAGLQQMGEDHQSVFVKEIGEVWQKMHQQMAAAREDHEQQSVQSLELIAAAVRGWQDELARATAAVTAQIRELERQSQILHDVAGNEEELVRLQTTLTHNLQSVRAVEAFEESIHSLNAAVHLLTMRAKAHAA